MSEEMIDVLDDQGEKTGISLTMDDIHSRGEWHRTVHVWLVTPRGELLLQLREPNMPTFPNCWDISSAGHISSGETSHQGVLREVSEELNLIVEDKECKYLGSVKNERVFKNGTYINKEFQDVYLITKEITLDQLTVQPSEVSDVRLLSWKKVKEHIDNKDSIFVPHDEEYNILFSELAKRFS